MDSWLFLVQLKNIVKHRKVDGFLNNMSFTLDINSLNQRKQRPFYYLVRCQNKHQIVIYLELNMLIQHLCLIDH